MPNNSFKPTPLRGIACVPALRLHAFAATARVGLTQALGPMPYSIAAVTTVVAGIAAVGLAVATWIISERFFRALVAKHPELADSFPRPMMFTRYGPILPSRMSYLKERRFNELPEADLKQQGRLSLNLLTAHAVLFTTFILSALWWNAIDG